VFYGAMISESFIALIWAAIAMAFFGSVEGLNTELYTNGKAAAVLVDVIANETLGKWIAYLVMFGVVGAAIATSLSRFMELAILMIVIMILCLPHSCYHIFPNSQGAPLPHNTILIQSAWPLLEPQTLNGRNASGIIVAVMSLF
jgi:Na+-driven multidrug efflux pump